MLRVCHEQANVVKIADTSGKEYTGRQVLINSLVLKRFLRRAVLDRDERYIGVLIPTSCACTLVNLGLTMDKRVAVNLNFTVSEPVMNYCIHKAGIRHILTSRKVMAKLKYEHLDAELIYFEDLLPKISLADKLYGLVNAYLPPWILERELGLDKISPDDVLTIIFTSGSTGVPKGVMLTHNNLTANITSFIDFQQLSPDNILLGVLPSFHSMGFSYNMWTIFITHFRCAYHYTPLETREIGKLCQKYQCTLMAGAPTFLRSYVRKCSAEELSSIKTVLVGAERMPVELMDAWERKFGVRPLEAFGCTECAPVVTANRLPTVVAPEGTILCKEGSIGQALPGVRVEIRDLDSGAVVKPGQVGMMWAKGPNVMKGYLDEPEKTAEALVDGWYCTGDLATLDEDGFVTITGRLSRFSKIGGEMVPHEGIENMISSIIGFTPDDPISVSVSSIADPKKGEKLIVLYTELRGWQPSDIVREMRNREQPPIWIPALDAFYQVDQIPVLGTGKLDIQGAKRLAQIVTDPLLGTRGKEDATVVGSEPESTAAQIVAPAAPV